MRTLALRLFIFLLSRLTGTGCGQVTPMKLAYKYVRRMLLPKDVIDLNIHGLKMFQHGRCDYRDSDETLFTNGYERMEMKMFDKIVRGGMTVVDIGANVGYYTLIACRNVGDKGKVFAYEPELSNYQLLLKNLEVNGFRNFVPSQQAVSNRKSKANLFLSTRGHGEHSLHNSGHNLGTVVVETITLDECLDGQVDVVKMDIEGGEMLALIGMSEIARRNDQLKLFIEFYPIGIQRSGYEPEDFWRKLRKLGFNYIYVINEKKHRLELGDCDYAMAFCRQRTKDVEDNVVSAINLLCSKHPLNNILKVNLVGAYPPPYGGVSVHVQRLKNALTKAGVNCEVFVYRGVSRKRDGILRIRNRMLWFLGQMFGKRDEIIHCHGYSPLALIFLSVLAFAGRKVVVTTHGFLFRGCVPWLHRLAFGLASKTGMRFVVTSDYVRDIVTKAGARVEQLTDIISVFIPPREDNNGVPDAVESFIANHNPVIAANAYKIVFYNDTDLYGIDMCVDLCVELKNDHHDVGLVFCLPDIGDHEYYDNVLRRVRRLGMQDNILFVTESCEFCPILKKCDLFVRPTNIDDFGISVAEAVYFGIPAIASDVCHRAEGTVLFKSRDANDFVRKTREVLGNYRSHKERLKAVKFKDSVVAILDVYRGL